MSAGPALAGPEPSVATMRSMVDRLSGEEFAGRRVGTPGGRAAASWLAGELQGIGAAVRVDEFPVRGAVREVYALPVVTVGGLRASDLVFRRDFCEHLASADQRDPLAGPAVIPGGEVRGAWVVDRSWSAARSRAWHAEGALGVLVPRGTDAAGWMPKMIAGPISGDVPVLALRTDLHAELADAGHPVTVGASVPVRTVDVTGTNVLGVFRSPPPRGLSVLLTAHFDGVGDDPDGTRFPASCDNAAGVAAVVEAARMLHALLPSDVGLAVALLDAEEAGAFGSAHHAAFVEDGTFVLNLDGAAQLGAAAAIEAGGPAESLLVALDLAGRAVGIPMRAEPMPSDNRRFAAAGLPSIGIGMGMPGYQTPAEHPDRVDSATLAAAAGLLVGTVRNLASGFNLGRKTDVRDAMIIVNRR